MYKDNVWKQFNIMLKAQKEIKMIMCRKNEDKEREKERRRNKGRGGREEIWKEGKTTVQSQSGLECLLLVPYLPSSEEF